jgi:hypothetical protein
LFFCLCWAREPSGSATQCFVPKQCVVRTQCVVPTQCVVRTQCVGTDRHSFGAGQNPLFFPPSSSLPPLPPPPEYYFWVVAASSACGSLPCLRMRTSWLYTRAMFTCTRTLTVSVCVTALERGGGRRKGGERERESTEVTHALTHRKPNGSCVCVCVCMCVRVCCTSVVVIWSRSKPNLINKPNYLTSPIN